jgi:hypothetical protein
MFPKFPKSFQQIADERLPKGSVYDWAIPQPVYDEMTNYSNLNPAGHIVWLYDNKAATFGRPFSITLLGGIILKIYNTRLGIT